MTENEIKAREIAQKTHTVWRDEEGEDISSQDDCYEAAMQMAQYKDRQFAEKIKAKAKEYYNKGESCWDYESSNDAFCVYDFLAAFYNKLTVENL